MRDRPTTETRLVFALLAALLAVTAGCHKPEPPPAAYVGPTLAGSDLGLEKIECPPTGFVILERRGSHGRFPGALAVARLHRPDMPEEDTDSASRSWQIETMKEEQATYWTKLFNTVPELREVVVLDRLSVGSPDADLAAITVSAGRVQADLCLIFGPSPAEPGHSGLTGAIMDTHTGRLVAFVQAQAGPADFQPPPEDRFEEDLRHQDCNYLVARKFEHQVWCCLVELIGRDQPLPTTLPSPWKSAASRPAAYPPILIIPNRPITW